MPLGGLPLSAKLLALLSAALAYGCGTLLEDNGKLKEQCAALYGQTKNQERQIGILLAAERKHNRWLDFLCRASCFVAVACILHTVFEGCDAAKFVVYPSTTPHNNIVRCFLVEWGNICAAGLLALMFANMCPVWSTIGTIKWGGKVQGADLKTLQDRVKYSLPGFEILSATYVTNSWTDLRYHYSPLDNERELFHVSNAPDDLVERGNSGLTPIFCRGGEYGIGIYLAEHAAYPVAYRQAWMFQKEDVKSPPPVTLYVVQTKLGDCKDFGPRCRSERSKGAPITPLEWAGVDHKDKFMTDAEFRRGPLKKEKTNVHYDSVTGTEGNLSWSLSKYLQDNGETLGKQYCVFDPAQVRLHIKLVVQRKSRAAPS